MKKFLAFLLTLLAAAYIFVFILPSFTEKSNILEGKRSFEGVLTVWHIEGFEGGAFSRASWLSQVALAYEQENKGIYVHINTLTYEQAKQKLQEGQVFDLISFPSGGGLDFLPYLTSFKGTDNTAGSFSLAGRYKGMQYALPYLAGVYCLFVQQSLIEGYTSPLEALFSPSFSYRSFKKPSFSHLLCACTSEDCVPLYALYSTNKKSLNITASQSYLALSQYKAYEAYLNGKAPFLAGTQRDAYRLYNRYLSGQIGELAFSPLTGFNDLLQFVAAGNFEESKSDFAQDFMEYLTSDKTQRKVARLEMFSPCINNLYEGGWQKLFEQALYKTENFLHAFAEQKQREELQNQAAEKLFSGVP